MMEEYILSEKQKMLMHVIKNSFEESQSHSKALAIRILGEQNLLDMNIEIDKLNIADAKYGGYPEVAALGFMFPIRENVKAEDINRFLDGLNRLKSRPAKKQPFESDDVAILGFAEGLNYIMNCSPTTPVDEIKSWLLNIISSSQQTKTWTYRMRELAGDLLDRKNRLQVFDLNHNVDQEALEIAVRHTWQDKFLNISPLPQHYFENLFSRLLQSTLDLNDLEKAVCWLFAINMVIAQASKILFPISNKEKIAVDRLTIIKDKLERRAALEMKLALLVCGIFIFLYWISLILLTIIFSWDIMEPWVTFLPVPFIMISYLYFGLTKREFSPLSIYEKISNERIKKTLSKCRL